MKVVFKRNSQSKLVARTWVVFTTPEQLEAVKVLKVISNRERVSVPSVIRAICVAYVEELKKEAEKEKRAEELANVGNAESTTQNI